MAAFFRTAFVTFVLCAMALLAYWKLTYDSQTRALAELKTLNEQMKQTIAEREAMIERLGRSRRIAHVIVKDQQEDQAGVVKQTRLMFIELNENGAELAHQEFTIPGDVLYIDGWTIKFDPERVAEGNPLMGHTLVLLRRIYSDQLAPKDGFAIDTPGAIPPGYAATDAGRFEKQLWENFWKIATDADMARSMGVRVAQGEAVYKPVHAGQTFELIADAAGGLSLMPLAKEGSALTKVSE